MIEIFFGTKCAPFLSRPMVANDEILGMVVVDDIVHLRASSSI